MSITVFYILILSFLIGDKYAVSLQYLKKELNYEVDVLHADKHESLLQVDIIIFDGFDQACPKYLDEFAISLSHLKKEVKDLAGMVVSNTVSSLNMESIPSLFFI